MNTTRYLAGAVLAAMAFSSCDEDTLTIGQSLTGQSDQLELAVASFPVTTSTMIADSVLSLSSKCFFGKVKDPETGAFVTSEFTSQFHVVENIYIASEESIVGRENGRAAADSCDVVLYLASPFRNADSLTAMKMRVVELEKPIEENQLFYTNFDPVGKGLVRNDEGAVSQGKVFTYQNLTDTDSLRSTSTYLHNVRIPLNKPYTAKDGVTYNNYGTYIMQQYYDHHDYFNTPYAFAHHVCPGFFFEVVDGLGVHAQVTDIGLRVFYRSKTDSVVNRSAIFAGTKEVLQTTRITNDQEAIAKLAAETGHTYLKSPAGLFTQVTLPVEAIKNYTDQQRVSHANDSLLAAKLTLQRVNAQSADERLLDIPKSILMVQQDSLTSFFEKNKVPDNITSYYTTYSSTYNTYTFVNISDMVTALWNQREKGMKTEANWEANHPNWNKVVLVPITYTTSSSTGSIVSIEHDMSLTSTRLLGGSDSNNSPIEISVVYAKFK